MLINNPPCNSPALQLHDDIIGELVRMGRVFYNYASLRRVSAHAQIQRRLRNGRLATETAEEREARLAKHRV